jgi:hypothetical protein
MKVISLWQPYAALIFAGVKQHETRHWKPPADLIEETFGLHASKTVLPKIHTPPELEALCVRALGAAWRHTIARGALLGTVVLTGFTPTEAIVVDEDDRIAGNYEPGRYAWGLRSPQALAMPLPMIGRQGWWTIDPKELIYA